MTRYPEAVALKSIDVEHVAEELIPLFTRVAWGPELDSDKPKGRLLSSSNGRVGGAVIMRSGEWHAHTVEDWMSSLPSCASEELDQINRPCL